MTLPDLAFVRPWAWWLLLLVPVLMLASRWRPRRLRPGRGAMALRSLVLILLLATLAGPLLVQGADETTTVFVIDRSASIQAPAGEAANDWVIQALDSAGADDAAAIVTFGAEPDLAVPPADIAAIGDEWLSTTVPVEATDLASALSLARSLPVGENRRIVVLSDGAENAGNALEQADQAANDGVAIDVVPLAGVEPTELRIEQVSGPTSLWQGDPMPLLVSIGSGGGGEATIDLVIDGVPVSSETVTLNPGQTVYSLATPPLAPGFHAVEVRVSGTEGDRIEENNTGYLGVVVREQPSVLLVAPVGSDPTRLEQALTAQGAAITVLPPEGLPSNQSGLGDYDAIVLNNVSAWELGDAQQQAVIAHTQEGNGLIVVGGSAAYGPGSYAGTPLERAMPVTVKVVDGQQRPTVAVLVIMDKSGSMSYDPAAGSVSKIDLAK
ncbi:MAG TPA: VWA domain-containing protein, partial [Thermomicrobiales bacterium]|nr:VWA domain-containing protein [Thermomicrobiales bacterium]